MARSKRAATAFAALSVAFFLIALVPAFRGERPKSTFVALGALFFVISMATARTRPPSSPGPGA